MKREFASYRSIQQFMSVLISHWIIPIAILIPRSSFLNFKKNVRSWLTSLESWHRGSCIRGGTFSVACPRMLSTDWHSNQLHTRNLPHCKRDEVIKTAIIMQAYSKGMKRRPIEKSRSNSTGNFSMPTERQFWPIWGETPRWVWKRHSLISETFWIHEAGC